MATQLGPQVPLGTEADGTNAAVQRTWRNRVDLSSFVASANQFLAKAGFDRGPWLAVAFASGIATWFVLDAPWQWAGVICGCALLVIWVLSSDRNLTQCSEGQRAIVGLATAMAAGVIVVWLRSATIGAEPIDYPRVDPIEARILEREEQPALARVRLTLAMRDAETGMARKVRVNLAVEHDRAAFSEGAIIRLRARLMPPAPPMLPGGYDFARSAWFQGLSATGSAVGQIELVEANNGGSTLGSVQRSLSAHVRSELEGPAATIAAALASGDRGAISQEDEDALRNSGLTHLLSISGLHVSAVIAAVYLLALRLLALWPWLALRARLPLLAASIAALAGLGYTLLTGSEVPTVRSCVGALLVLVALAIGREPLSIRMVAVAAALVLLVWPEALVGPSFQMSFAAVLAIVSLHNAGSVRAFLAPREEGWVVRLARRATMLLVTGLVIELALMPIVLFHFHRAGVYGAFANVVAIPLVTFVTMPLIALALTLDLAGQSSPVWWMVQYSLDLLMDIAHFAARQPGAVKLMPQMDAIAYSLFIAGSLWLALWRDNARLWGFTSIVAATGILLTTPTPDVLISGDGKHVGIAGEGDKLLILRDGRSGYARDKLLEMAGMNGEPIALEDWPGADCSRDFCVMTLTRGGLNWTLLMARNSERIEERSLAAACARSDIVIADRWLPRSCRPKWLKADRHMLSRTGGMALYMAQQRIDTVAEGQGAHGWWNPSRDEKNPVLR